MDALNGITAGQSTLVAETRTGVQMRLDLLLEEAFTALAALPWAMVVMADDRNPRQRARTLRLEPTAWGAIARTRGTAVPGIDVDHGGTVANKYGYPADTECVLAIADAQLRLVYVWAGKIPANKATLSGALRELGPAELELRPIYDRRFAAGGARELAAREAALAWVHSHRSPAAWVHAQRAA